MTVDGAPDDRELMRRHAAGDPQAFEMLVVRHRERLWAVALRTLRHPEDAADALQDALLSAYRASAPGGTGYRGEASPTTWLHRIVVNACLDRARRAAVRRAEPLDTDVAAAVPDPVDAVTAADRSLVIADALATLPPEQRAALVLVDMQGFSVDEAAAVLGCATGTVKSRCARGRAKLAPLLRDLAGDADPSGAVDPPTPASAVSRNLQRPRRVPSAEPPAGPTAPTSTASPTTTASAASTATTAGPTPPVRPAPSTPISPGTDAGRRTP